MSSVILSCVSTGVSLKIPAIDDPIFILEMCIMQARVRRQGLWSGIFIGVVCGMVAMRPLGRTPLSPVETACLGQWEYLSPDHTAPTLIVYHFRENRRVCEEHYYLTSATPTVPRITMLGQWYADGDRLIVDRSRGAIGALDQSRGWVRDALGDSERWPRPVLTRFYQIKSTATDALTVQCQRSGGKGNVEIVMRPFDPANIAQKVP